MLASPSPRLSAAIADYVPGVSSPFLLGILPGEGVGPEVTAAAVAVLEALSACSGRRFALEYHSGPIGSAAQRELGQCLPPATLAFCDSVFARQGALLCGPGGHRFVYEMRAHYDLYCKLTPLQARPILQDTGPLRPAQTDGVDIIAVRENMSGFYFGDWGRRSDASGDERAFHHASYSVSEIDRILRVAQDLAARRRGQLCVAVKPHGVPAISQLWEERARLINAGSDVALSIVEIDNAAYQLIANPQRLDVIVSPNMFGDVLADCGALLLGSRGMSFSGNYGVGKAVYQTGHGAAYDIAGTDTANPLGQILSLAMLLRESANWPAGADWIEAAMDQTLAHSRTRDIAAPGRETVGTREMARRVAEAVTQLAPVAV